MKHLLHILFFLFLTLAQASKVCAAVTDADDNPLTEQQLDSLRQTDDFVRASLVVVDPGDVLYSMLGHVALRMQCPTFDKDFVYSYESEGVQNKVARFLMGDLKMGMFPIETAEFVSLYAPAGRGVREYELNLTPAQKGNLWRVLDEHVAEGSDIPYDYFHRGCAIMIVNLLHEALGAQEIAYAPWPDKYRNFTTRELVQTVITEAKDDKQISPKAAAWNAFFMYALIGVDGDKDYPCERKLIVPNDLVEVWQQASVNGKKLLNATPNNLYESQPKSFAPCWLTPMVVAIALLILALLGWYSGWQWTTWLIMAVVTAVGMLITYLLVFSSLPCTDWNWLIIPFNILPALAWHWRRYWALLYAIGLCIWLVVMIAWPHIIVSTPYLILTLAEIIALRNCRFFAK